MDKSWYIIEARGLQLKYLNYETKVELMEKYKTKFNLFKHLVTVLCDEIQKKKLWSWFQ